MTEHLNPPITISFFTFSSTRCFSCFGGDNFLDLLIAAVLGKISLEEVGSRQFFARAEHRRDSWRRKPLWLMMQSPQRRGFTRVYVSHMFVDVSVLETRDVSWLVYWSVGKNIKRLKSRKTQQLNGEGSLATLRSRARWSFKQFFFPEKKNFCFISKLKFLPKTKSICEYFPWEFFRT